MATETSDKLDAWSIRGFLQKTSRHNIREEIREDDDNLHVFRVSEQADKENVNSPLPMVSVPTLMKIRNCEKDEFAELTQQVQNLQQEVDCLRTSKVIVDCAECILRVSHVMNQKLIKLLGKTLEKVDEAERSFLLAGPFEEWRARKRLCGTYFDLLQFYDRKPSPKVQDYLQKVELKAVQIFEKMDCESQQQTSCIRMMFRNFLANGKALRDVESHIGMVKDKETKDALLHRTEVYGKVTLEKFGLESLFPLVSAGIFVHRNGEPEDVSDSEGHGHLPPTSSEKKVISKPSLSTRVTFLVKKKVPLMHVVGLFGRLQRLGNNDPEKTLHMACKDGLSWERIVEIPCDATFMFSFVVLEKTIGQKKWTVVEGPIDAIEAHVGSTTTPLLLQHDWLDDAKLPPAAYGKTETSKGNPADESDNHIPELEEEQSGGTKTQDDATTNADDSDI